MAQELKYPPGCLVTFYNRERAQKNAENSGNDHKVHHKKEAHPIVFSELVSYICETKIASEESKLPADLVHLYKEQLEQLGSEAIDVNSTRLKDQLIFAHSTSGSS